MAQLTIHGTWQSIAALALLFAFVGVLVYAIVSGESMGLWPYALVLAATVFGFWSKEDHIAIGGIMGLSALVILDVLFRVGILAFNECHSSFAILSGC